MEQELLRQLQAIIDEELAILKGAQDIGKELYTSQKDFIIDSQKLLQKGFNRNTSPYQIHPCSQTPPQLCGNGLYVQRQHALYH